jgi:2-polyprenyl-3-methyl-5-hydroxy-6-metoxy-1,4-benzoquinol methylase
MRTSNQSNEAIRRLQYDNSPEKQAQRVRELVRRTGSRTVLDYGSGGGRLSSALPDLVVWEHNFASSSRDAEQRPADLVMCLDVLEHIEPDRLDDQLKHILSVTGKFAFFYIATRPADTTLPDGRNAHLIVQPQDWWRTQIERYFEIADWTPDRDWAVSALVRPLRDAKASKAWFTIPGVQEGRWGLDRQMAGLDIVRRAASGASVLDLGCAEGVVSLELAKSGATLVHGVDLEASRLRVADELFEKQCPTVSRQFIEWELSRFDELFLDVTADSRPGQPRLRTRYDIVLCLAIAQKLPNPAWFLRLAATLCSDLFVVRIPYPVIDDARSFNDPVDVKRMVSDEFELIQETEGYPKDVSRPYKAGDDSWLGIFRRHEQNKARPNGFFSLFKSR